MHGIVNWVLILSTYGVCPITNSIFHKIVIRFCCSRVESHAHAVTGEAEAESEEEDRVAVVHVAVEEEIAELEFLKILCIDTK